MHVSKENMCSSVTEPYLSMLCIITIVWAKVMLSMRPCIAHEDGGKKRYLGIVLNAFQQELPAEHRDLSEMKQML